jgi:hypothetical protein
VDESQAWLHQASSDQQAGERERQAFNQGGIPTLCHAVAKYQQTVEKAIKAAVTALREAGFANWRVGRGHEVTPYMSMLFRLPRKEENKSVLQELGKLLDGNTRRGIKSLETLAPKWPAQGQIPLRNTEYPFEDGKGGWSYPAAVGVFLGPEVEEFRRLASRVQWGVDRIVKAIRRVRK